MTASVEFQRLDRWLWYARIVKSRTRAAGLISDGCVRVDRAKVTKPSFLISPGNVLTVVIGRRVRVLKVEQLAGRRGPATEAAGLYLDLAAIEPTVQAGQ